MTSSVVVTAHCAKDKEVIVSIEDGPAIPLQEIRLQDTETYSVSVYDNKEVRVREVNK